MAGTDSTDADGTGTDSTGTDSTGAGPGAGTKSPDGAGPGRRAIPTGRGPLARAADFARGVLGADRYRQYLAFHARSGCEQPPLSEKEYWRDYYRHQEEHPGARCC